MRASNLWSHRPRRRRLRLLWPDLDFLARGLEALGADSEVDARIVHRLQGVLEREIAVLQQLQLLVELRERLLVGEVLGHGSTSSTRAASRPAASLMRSPRPLDVPLAARRTAPDSASCVML